jgi:8-oxo-dGTP diphosphatase
VEYPGHVVAVTGFVRDEAEQVLLVRVRDRGWEMPGGQVELGEDLPSALAREVDEECGCRVKVERLIGVYSKLTEPSMVLLLFRCTYLSGDAQPREEAVPEAGWFSPKDAARLVAGSPSAQRLADALAFDGELVYRVYRVRPYEPLLERRI